LKPTPHNILSPEQRLILTAVFDVGPGRDRFALVGGTALAEYYLGHRLSRDLDLFAEDPADVAPLASALPGLIESAADGTRVDELQRGAGFRRFEAVLPGSEPVQVDIGAVDPPLLGPVARSGGVNVLSLQDLAVGKVLALHDRAEIRDAIDLWALERAGVDLEQVRRQALAKDPGLRLSPMAAVDSLQRIGRMADKVPSPAMLVALDTPALVAFVEDLASRYARAIRDEIP